MPQATLKPNQLRVRMYRVGFGDCFLLSVPVADKHKHILIDCGVHAKGDIQTMPDVVADLRKETGDKIELVVVTHAHQDHISGFGTQAREFKNITVNEIWMPWTEDPADAQAVRLRGKQMTLARQLHEHLRAIGKLTKVTDSILENFVGFSLVSNAESMRVARGGFRGPQKVRYLRAGAKLAAAAGIANFGVQVLGPSRDESALTKMNPPVGQRWLRTDGVGAASDCRVEPFKSWKCGRADGRRKADCVLDRKSEKALQNTVVANDSLALMLDDVLNNTSLVLLLRYRGATLLFPGDAQWGSWSSWLARSDAESILNEVTFFKVPHHGSHNGTPRTIVPKLSHPELAAMISTQNTPWQSIPKTELLMALDRQSAHRMMRSDWIEVAAAPKAQGARKARRPFVQGSFWADYVREL